MSLIESRLAALDDIVLGSGAHDSFDDGICVMEAAAWVAGEEWSDSPQCVSPIIAAFCRRWNDDLDDDGRQMLKPFIPRLVGTRGTAEQERIRGLMCADWLIRIHTPAWLRLAGLDTAADALAGLPEIDSWDKVEAATEPLRSAGDAAWSAWSAAGDAAGSARHAAGAAAWSAWYAAAAAWSAGSAAGAAAWAAAWDAAAAAWYAGCAADVDALKPTVLSLQESAKDLLDRMIAVTGQDV